MVLKRIFYFLKQWSRKRQIRGKCNGSITAAVWRRLTAQLAEAGLVTADVLAAAAVVVGREAGGGFMSAGKNSCSMLSVGSS